MVKRVTSYSTKRRARVYRIKKRPFFKSRGFWLFLLSLAAGAGLFYLVFFSSFFRVRAIGISGAQKTNPEKLKKVLQSGLDKKFLFFSSRSIFFVNSSGLQERILKEFPRVAGAKIKRRFPDKISVEIEEKKPVAVFCSGQQENECFLVDREGIVFDRAKDSPSLAKIIGEIKPSAFGKRVIEKDYLDGILEIQKEVKKGGIKISSFALLGKKLVVQTSEGWQVFFDPTKDISAQIFNLTALLKNKITPDNRHNLNYIDLRFSKVYLKEKDINLK